MQQTRTWLEQELRKKVSAGEASAMTRLILEHAGYPPALLIRDPLYHPGSAILTQIKEIVTEIHRGRPIQYVLGYTHFLDLKIMVDERVLIPRPETEEMVSRILESHALYPARILDLGTGSGCIALALKKHFPEAAVSGLDVSPDALAVARHNGRLNGLHVDWILGDLRKSQQENLPGEVDLLVSNPPYVRDSERALMQPHVLDHEPEEALFAPPENPLLYYRIIAELGSGILSGSGEIWVEINENLGKETARIFTGLGFGDVTIIRDIHEKERFIRAGQREDSI